MKECKEVDLIENKRETDNKSNDLKHMQQEVDNKSNDLKHMQQEVDNKSNDLKYMKSEENVKKCDLNLKNGIAKIDLKKREENKKIKRIGLVGNPNVGKSTVFNALTGLKQHTGNWTGKTVTNAVGNFSYNGKEYELVDLPGTYSLISHSAEEEVTRDFVMSKNYDAIIVICDAVCLERNLNLVLQLKKVAKNLIVGINLLDEAAKKKIKIDILKLSDELRTPVVGMSARNNEGLEELKNVLEGKVMGFEETSINNQTNENVCANTNTCIEASTHTNDNINTSACIKASAHATANINTNTHINANTDTNTYSEENKIEKIITLEEEVKILKEAEKIANKVVSFEKKNYDILDRKIDRILTNKITGIPIMLGMLGIILWLTIQGANYPSQILFEFLFWLGEKLESLLQICKIPEIAIDMLINGMYRVLAWVVAVMLPPMAIFFPLFTLLEDLGVLPRIAFNLDGLFKKCSACGKQALTMCMGFGCNACGVTGCRIIDSPRERLIAILTNSFIPCNGRFPTLISIITMFLIGKASGAFETIQGVLLLLGFIILGILMTFFASRILSKTILKGKTSSFILELPPYRKPQIGKVLIRSIFDRTLFVLGRAITIAAPTGILIWIFTNIEINQISILSHCSNFLEPFANLIGLDGTILMAFILGFPANEIVMPIILMAYMSTGQLIEMDNLIELKEILVANGWTITTAICTMIFSMFHWPCSTTCLTIKKETGSWKWTMIAVALPTAIGIALCFLVNAVTSL